MKMNNKTRILWITRTAVFTALIIVLQAVTAALGNTLLTGSIVNLLLIVTVMTSGYASGLTVALISPVVAKLVGIGPLWELIPFISIGNITLVSIWRFLGNKKNWKPAVTYIITLACAAVAKFLVLYAGIVLFAVPILLKLPDPQAGVVSSMFSFPQLFTALIGGGIASVILPTLKKAIGKG